MKSDIPPHGFGKLDNASGTAEHLHALILERLHDEGDKRWAKGMPVSASGISVETGMSRVTVTKALSRLVKEAYLEVQRGAGYRIIAVEHLPRSTTVVSVTEFCEREDLECVSVLDRESLAVSPFGDLASDATIWGNDPFSYREKIREGMAIEDDEAILLVRRVRGFRRKGAGGDVIWAILETLFLVERKVPYLKDALISELPSVYDPKPLGNISLHRWLKSNSDDLERSEYSLDLKPLVGRDADIWMSLAAPTLQKATDPFIRLRAITFGKRNGPILYTQESLVPSVFNLGVSGFRFRAGPALD